MKMDWEDFIENAFDQIEVNKIPNLIIDIRGNGGGNDEVYIKLSEYIINKPIEVELGKSLLRYEKVPEDLNKYLNTWDDSFRDRAGQLVKLDNGYYSDPDRETSLSIDPGSKAYNGKMYLLIDASNASATFILARIAKANALATLIGEETGGNRRGINGSQLFFLRLPNSKIEIDIPLIGNYPVTPQPDEGVKPDIFVKQTAEDFISGRDTVLETVKKIILDN
jgi:C-terminal processing protease CtpA/Prc